MSKKKPNSLMSLVEAYVLEQRLVTNKQVLAALGKKISIQIAASTGRREFKYNRKRKKIKILEPKRLITNGRRCKINDTLVYLIKSGRIRRISPGLYGPPLPKIFESENDEHNRTIRAT